MTLRDVEKHRRVAASCQHASRLRIGTEAGLRQQVFALDATNAVRSKQNVLGSAVALPHLGGVNELLELAARFLAIGAVANRREDRGSHRLQSGLTAVAGQVVRGSRGGPFRNGRMIASHEEQRA